MSMTYSASIACELQTFCPEITQRSPSRVARVVRPARSDPEPGSLNSWHHARLPLYTGVTCRSICSGVPWVRIVGAAIIIPRPLGGGTAPKARNARYAVTCARRV
jgi:hypothetical protein